MVAPVFTEEQRQRLIAVREKLLRGQQGTTALAETRKPIEAELVSDSKPESQVEGEVVEAMTEATREAVHAMQERLNAQGPKPEGQLSTGPVLGPPPWSDGGRNGFRVR
jgi:hypothetical protein